jgi:hypothetical protein
LAKAQLAVGVTYLSKLTAIPSQALRIIDGSVVIMLILEKEHNAKIQRCEAVPHRCYYPIFEEGE